MAQFAYPAANDEFTDAQWRDLFGDQTGITDDLDGSAYRITLSTNSDVANLGSDSQDSLARVSGFGHRVPLGQQEGVTIPEVTGGTQRTDVVALRYDPAYTGPLGPVRLVVIPGTPGSPDLPVIDTTRPGVVNLPLWAVTRSANAALSTATIRSLRSWIGPVRTFAAGTALPSGMPIGSTVWIGRQQHQRTLTGTQPGWNSVPDDVLERLLDLTRRTPHVGSDWGTGGGYGPVWVLDGNWNVPSGSAVRVDGCIQGHAYDISAMFTTVASHAGMSGIIARLGLVVGSGQPTGRLGAGASILTQQHGVVSAHPGPTYEQTMPTVLRRTWVCPADGSYWFYPVFATSATRGFAIRNQFGQPRTEVTDLGPMTIGPIVKAGG